MDENIILQVNNLNKQFRSGNHKIQAINNISFNVKKGETFALVGESGCGKTTTGRLLIKLVDADSGEIIFKGTNISNLSNNKFRKLRPSIQIIFQDPYGSLNPRMKIKKLLSEAVKSNTENKSDINDVICELIKSVGLEVSDLDKYPHEFTGGQRQRICIARAIATQPDLIICDEPVSALDLLVQAQILNLLKELQKKYGFSYIFISHNLSVVRYISDRVAVMCMGKIVEEGTTEEIFNNPSHIYTKLLLDSILDLTDNEKSEDLYKTYYDDKYQVAIDYVSKSSSKLNWISPTHYVLQDI
ncbi:MAG: ABC transporter ATP-binding protein [Tissierellia bacterium]|nr:ABC transporter ATP-binding protein [Tissierellia bacterium]